MPESTPVPQEEPRRGHPRLRLGIGAYLQTLDGPQKVRLLDLSQSGAHLVLTRGEPLRQAFLTWLGFEVFGDIVWQRGREAGMRFDRPLAIAQLVETRRAAPSVVDAEAHRLETEARDWVEGYPGRNVRN
jgi:hypothetical protein